MLPIITLPVQSDAKYDNIIGEYVLTRNYTLIKLKILLYTCMMCIFYFFLPAGIYNFEPKYWLAGGINKPKKIMCVGTDGIKRTLLVKVRGKKSIQYKNFALYERLFIDLTIIIFRAMMI